MNVDIFTTVIFACLDSIKQKEVVKWHALLRFITSMNTDFLDDGLESKLAELFKQINHPRLIEKEIGEYFEFCRTKEQPIKQRKNFYDFYIFRSSFKQTVDCCQNLRRKRRKNLIQSTTYVPFDLSKLHFQVTDFIVPNPIIYRLLEPSAVELDQRASLQWQRDTYIKEGMEFW